MRARARGRSAATQLLLCLAQELSCAFAASKRCASAHAPCDVITHFFVRAIAGYNAVAGRLNSDLPLLYKSGGRLSTALETLVVRNSVFTNATSIEEGTVGDMNGTLDGPIDVIEARLKMLKAKIIERNNTRHEISYYSGKLDALEKKLTSGAPVNPKDTERKTRNHEKKAQEEEKLAKLDREINSDLNTIDEDCISVLDGPMESFMRMQAAYYRNASDVYAAALASVTGSRLSHAMVSSLGSTPGFDGATVAAAAAGGGGGTGRAGRPTRAPTEVVIADYDYVAQKPDELSFHAGDLFLLITEDAGDGWWVGRHGASFGLFPQTYVAKTAVDRDRDRETARAAFEYTTEDPSELLMKVGDHVKILSRGHPQWTLGILNGAVGYVPASYLEGSVPPGFASTLSGVAGGSGSAAAAGGAGGDTNPFDEPAASNPFGDEDTGGAGGGIEL